MKFSVFISELSEGNVRTAGGGSVNTRVRATNGGGDGPPLIEFQVASGTGRELRLGQRLNVTIDWAES